MAIQGDKYVTYHAKRDLTGTAKSIDPGQPPKSSQAEHGRNFSLLADFLCIKLELYLTKPSLWNYRTVSAFGLFLFSLFSSRSSDKVPFRTTGHKYIYDNSLLYNPVFDSFPNKPLFLHVCITSALKTPREKKKFLLTSNFFFSQCFLPIRRTFCHFHQIQNCHLSLSLEQSKSCCLGKS